tara:strand:- start:1369 stop:1548 length:180 start_codon:yes stop_codon:yes gene_type:complete
MDSRYSAFQPFIDGEIVVGKCDPEGVFSGFMAFKTAFLRCENRKYYQKIGLYDENSSCL